jgi:hypothetical protein
MTQRTVRLQVLSDLHLGNSPFEHPHTDADIVILAGDISRPAQAVQWAQGFKQPVLYVAGNHESYGSSIQRTVQDLKERANGTHIRFLQNDECILQGIRFLGTTLWSSFNLFDSEELRQQSIAAAVPFIRDFSRIESDRVPGSPFSPADMDTLFAQNRAWLAARLSEPFEGPTVVITHHAPSCRSVHPRFEGSLVNACFVSDSEHLMGKEKAVLWIHGHTHDSFDYHVRGTRVLCNPRGYMRDGVLENPAFNPQLTVEISVPGKF